MSELIKSASLIRNLQESLKLRGIANVSQVSVNTILITENAPAVDAEANMLIRIKPIDDDIARKDAFGLAQRVYNPHISQICLEEGADADLRDLLAKVVFELSRKGLGIQVFEQAAGASPVATEADFDTATKLYEIRDLLNPATGEV